MASFVRLRVRHSLAFAARIVILIVLIETVGFGQPQPGRGTAVFNAEAAVNPGAGGAAQADFDSLIELIQSTIAPTTWDDVGGEGSVMGFPGGVFVDTSGVMRQLDDSVASNLTPLWESAAVSVRKSTAGQDLARPSRLRKVSLNRLERQLASRAEDGLPPTVAMRLLAGLNRIDYLVYDEETADVIIAGPAGPWTVDATGRVVDQHSLRPVMRLDDFVVLLRNVFLGDGQFVCSITPTQERLAKTQAYLQESSRQPLKPDQRNQWIDGLRDALGHQQIQISGIDPETRVARVIVEADYHMKLIGIGLEPGTEDVPSYLDRIQLAPGESPPEMGVLHWWFTLREGMIVRNHDSTGFRVAPQVVRVLSENELLTQQGHRIHTGQSEQLNREFAESFTTHFQELAELYPVYAELDNVFRLAVVAAVMKQEDIPARLAWNMAYWLGDQKYEIPLGAHTP